MEVVACAMGCLDQPWRVWLWRCPMRDSTISAERAFHWGIVLGEKEYWYCVEVAVMVRNFLLWYERFLEYAGRMLVYGWYYQESVCSFVEICQALVFPSGFEGGPLEVVHHGGDGTTLMVGTHPVWGKVSSLAVDVLEFINVFLKVRIPNCPKLIQSRTHQRVARNGLRFLGIVGYVTANKVEGSTHFPSYGTGVSIPEKIIAGGHF